MKKNLRSISLTAFYCLASSALFAQWCVPTTLIPYSPAMPGITHVIVGSIDRVSSDLENYPNNSYVNTGMSTDLVIGNTYTISITHTIDGTICPDMNLRVWLDYNLDYSFDDAGETVVSVDHHGPGTWTGTFTIPSTVSPETTRMRVTAKMSNLGGHTLPTPCDMPNPDPLGYHGEMEDYTVNLISTTGIPNLQPNVFSVIPSVITDHATITFPSANVSQVKISNALGEVAWSKDLNASESKVFIGEDVLGKIQPGIYFVEVSNASTREVKKIIVQ